VACAIPIVVTWRHAVLAIGAFLVLVVAVHLFREVRARPAEAQVHATSASSPPAAAAHETETQDEPAARAGATPAPPAIVRKTDAPGTPAKINEIKTDDPEGSGGAGSAVRIDAIMAEANKAYDRGDFDEAKSIANKVLAKLPGNPRMLRILVSVACIDNDAGAAQAAYQILPAPDQTQMRTRCSRYGIDLK
jgi:hypothetical protein